MSALADYLAKSNRIPSKSFTLRKVKCKEINFLRAYLYQVLNSTFGFSEYIMNNYESLNKSIAELNIENLNEILNEEEIDNGYFYYFENKLESFDFDSYEDFPKLFTNIAEVSFDNGGLVVLECFFIQIYELYSANGEFIDGPCQDLNLLTEAKYISRSSSTRGDWKLNQYNNKSHQIYSLKKCDDFELENIYDRDRIEIPLEETGNIEATRIENFNAPISKIEADKILNDPETNWICSPELACYYFEDKELAISAVKKDILSYTLLSDKLKSDKDIMLTLVKNDGCAIIYTKNFNNSDHEIMLAAVSGCGKALQFANEELKSNKDFVIASVNYDGLSLEHASHELKKDLDVVMAAVKNKGLALEFANDDLRGNKNVVLAAVKNNDRALLYASDILKNDIEIITAAEHSKKNRPTLKGIINSLFS
jgi:hypothetical protein